MSVLIYGIVLQMFHMGRGTIVRNTINRILDFLRKQKVAIGTAALTALLLDIITGVIFGFGGAALFAAL